MPLLLLFVYSTNVVVTTNLAMYVLVYEVIDIPQENDFSDQQFLSYLLSRFKVTLLLIF